MDVINNKEVQNMIVWKTTYEELMDKYTMLMTKHNELKHRVLKESITARLVKGKTFFDVERSKRYTYDGKGRLKTLKSKKTVK